MESKDLRSLIMSGIKQLETPKGYKNIISRKNNLYRFDIINRLLILGQCNNAFDVRTREEWELLGRKVSDNNCILIIMPNIKAEYQDTNTLDIVDVKEFTPDELNKALKLNIITRVDSIDNIYTKGVFDIRQTQSINEYKYTLDKIKVKQSDILRIVQGILKCDIVKSEMTYYSSTDNILYVMDRANYVELSKYIIDVIVDKCTEQYLDILSSSFKDSSTDITEYDIDLLKNTVKYVIYELFTINEYIDLDIVRHTSNDKLLLILNIADSIISKIMIHTENSSNISTDAVHNINVYRKAEAILDIMEANELNNRMKGA